MLDKETMQKVYAIQRKMHENFRNTPKEGKIVEYLGREFIVYPSVFWPHADSQPLVKNYIINKGEEVLDLCTGSGVVAIQSALRGANKVVALDINPEAIRNTKENALRHSIEDKIDARVSDMFDSLAEDEKFDVITINPPFTLHSYEEKDNAEKTIWDENLYVHKRFFNEFNNHLKNEGRIYISQSNFGSHEIMKILALGAGLSFKKIGEEKFDDLRTFYAFELKRKCP